MYTNSFSVNVEGGHERESGYVELKHGTTYALKLRNDRDVPCDAIVEIDGKDMGGFRIEPHTSIRVERPANEAKRFTFYRIDSEEADQSGGGEVSYDDRGLVKVTFYPGSRKTEVVKTIQNRPNAWDALSRTRTKGKLSSPANFGLYERAGDLGAEAIAASGAPEASMGDSWDLEMGDAEVIPMGAMRGLIPQEFSTERRSGITGLSGSSYQHFDTTKQLPEYDQEHITEINIRLVAVEEQRKNPTPLRPVTRKTPVPPPIWMF